MAVLIWVKFENGKNTLGKNFTFHSNLSIPSKTLIPRPPLYKDIIKSFWCSTFYCSPNVPSSISSQCLWYNSYLKTDKKPFSTNNFLTKILTMLVICLAILAKLSLGRNWWMNLIWTKSFISSGIKLYIQYHRLGNWLYWMIMETVKILNI